MIAEGITALTTLVAKSLKPVPLPVKNPRLSYFVIDGEIQEIELPIPPRDHKAGSLEDLMNLANRFAADASSPCAPVVWYDHERVVLVIDDFARTDDDENAYPYRVEKATLELEVSDVFAALVKLRDNKPLFNQKDFIRLLRIQLAGTLDPARLLNVVRRVKFENGVTTTGEKTKNRESMGREINAAVSAEGDIPDEVTLSVPVYKTLRETDRYPVRCSVEVEPMEGVFRLMPLPDEIERVRNMALDSIEERLTGGLQGVPHYFGKP